MKKNSSPAKFITLEGGEGAGKSTSRDFIVSLLSDHSIPFVHTREPGGTPIGEALRELLLSKKGVPPSVTTELLLVFAARAQHLHETIEPALPADTPRWCTKQARQMQFDASAAVAVRQLG